jgi:hypothetical protein
MANVQTVSIDPIRVLAEASIGATYVAFGTPFTNPVRLIVVANNTDGDMYISDDGVNNKMFVGAGVTRVLDLNTNRLANDKYWAFPNNTQFYIKYITMPTKGAVYLEAYWGQ